MLRQYLTAHERLILQSAADAGPAVEAALMAMPVCDEFDAYVQKAAMHYAHVETERFMSYMRFTQVIPEYKEGLLIEARERLDVLRCIRER